MQMYYIVYTFSLRKPPHLMITYLINPFTGDLRLGCGAFQYLANHDRGRLMLLWGVVRGGGHSLLRCVCKVNLRNLK